MPPGPDETEELLKTLEAELSGHQQKIDERLAREEAERTALEGEVDSWTRRRDLAEAALQQVLPRRDAMVHRHEQLRLTGSKGNFNRAMLWSTGAALLFMGTTVPLAMVASKPQFFVTLLVEALAFGGGFGLAALVDAGKRR